MLLYVLRRLGMSVLTILGVMLITFLLFRVVAGDVAGSFLGPKATEKMKADWRHRNGYDRPMLINCHSRLMILDRSEGQRPLSAADVPLSNAANALSLVLESGPDQAPAAQGANPHKTQMLLGRYVWRLSDSTPVSELTDKMPLILTPKGPPAAATSQVATSAAAPTTTSMPTTSSMPSTEPASAPAVEAAAPAGDEEAGHETPAPALPPPAVVFSLRDGSRLAVDLRGVRTCGELLAKINDAPGNAGKLVASISPWRWGDFFSTQFFRHFWDSATFQTVSFKDNQKLTKIIAEKAPASLALQIPALALEWMIGLAIACVVAYYRGSVVDRLGVLLSVLGMCIPFLAFMIYGQAFMFWLSPRHAFGMFYPVNAYVPIAIMVIAGLGSQVRFYRTIILDETNRDYVRTAKAKGVPLPGILFKHVLKNCMLPILTSLILTIPFLFMGGLLVESYYGVPGLGDLMITSIGERNEPILSGMVFLTALIYTVGVLLTDITYAVFDPRIRLR